MPEAGTKRKRTSSSLWWRKQAAQREHERFEDGKATETRAEQRTLGEGHNKTEQGHKFERRWQQHAHTTVQRPRNSSKSHLGVSEATATLTKQFTLGRAKDRKKAASKMSTLEENAGGEAFVDRPAVKKYSLWSCGEAACWATCTQQTDLVVESRTDWGHGTPSEISRRHSTLFATFKSPSQRQFDNALGRLRFWSSPEMAPHVRSCTAIVKWHKSSRWHILTDSFFEFLPTFTGLRRLHLDRIRFTQKVIVDLCGLTKLKNSTSAQSKMESI
ncbi:hypothetical protein K438DRAFT_1780255 [Mycena galopus ATCC 62051]|nr:hypothetical protein K438DRAFT_1780255 [Mycena galopus ATCC 62051]